MTLKRRDFLKKTGSAGLAVGAGSIGFPYIASAQTKMTISTAYFPTYPGHLLEHINLQNGLFVKRAKEFGYDITLNHVEAQTGVAALEGVLAGELAWTHHGESPAATIISNQLPVYLGSPGDGGYGNTLMVRPDSTIGTLEELVDKKARIALRMASGQHGFCDALFRANFGKGPEELGIEMVDMSPSEAMLFPKGLDAVVSHAVIPFMMRHKGVAKFLVNNEGVPGSAWKGGVGADGKVDFFNNAGAYPEGFILYRGYNSYRRDLIDEHPNLYVAFMLATYDAAKIADQSRPEGQNLAYEWGKGFWGISKEEVMQQFAASITMSRRIWPWITEGDLKAVVNGAPMLYAAGRIRRPVTWDMVKEYVAVTGPLDKKAWEMTGMDPSIEEMTRTDVADVRGYPLWMTDEWEAKDVA